MKLPVSIWCKNCGNHINGGTKFNSRKEGVAVGETDLGIQISRFHFKCTRCEAELVMKSGPKNSDYIFEFGATTYFQPLRSEDEVVLKKTKRKDAVEVKDENMLQRRRKVKRRGKSNWGRRIKNSYNIF
ncbi:hypothetical protein MKX03_028956 [Papaver bracteatum]|nr:hypothetical protein MKX03_028956 [Papaver bracteatum]